MKLKKYAPSVTEYGVEEHVTDIFGDFEGEQDIDEHDANHAKVVKMSTSGKKIPKNIPHFPLDKVPFHSEKNVFKWKFVYHLRLAPKCEFFDNA